MGRSYDDQRYAGSKEPCNDVDGTVFISDGSEKRSNRANSLHRIQAVHSERLLYFKQTHMKDSTSVQNMMDASQASNSISQAPTGWKRFLWLGPSFLWMLSAAGSGEVLFTPRIAALYGYTLLWALLAAVILKWFINREVGRYTVCTGRTFIPRSIPLKRIVSGWPLTFTMKWGLCCRL